MHAGSRARNPRGLVTERPVGQSVDFPASRPAYLQTAFGISGTKSRPPDQIAKRRRTMTSHISASQLRESLVAVEPRGGRSTSRQERISGLLPTARPATDDSLELGMHRDVRQLSGPKRQTGAMELDAQLSPGQMAPITQSPLDDPGRTIHHA